MRRLCTHQSLFRVLCTNTCKKILFFAKKMIEKKKLGFLKRVSSSRILSRNYTGGFIVIGKSCRSRKIAEFTILAKSLNKPKLREGKGLKIRIGGKFAPQAIFFPGGGKICKPHSREEAVE